MKKAIAMSLPSTGHGYAFCKPLPCCHHPLWTLSPSSSTTQILVLCCWHNRLIRHRSTPRTSKENPSHQLHAISPTPLSFDFLPKFEMYFILNLPHDFFPMFLVLTCLVAQKRFLDVLIFSLIWIFLIIKMLICHF